MKFLADKSSLTIKNDLPLVSRLDLSKFNKSKLVIKDQWASHPSTEERISNLERINITKDYVKEQSANLLFNDIETLQENLTKKLFSFVENADQLSSLQIEDFKTQYHTDFENNSFNKMYNGYYDHKNPNYFDIVTATGVVNQNHNIEYFFSKENIDMIYDYLALENDKNTLINIENKTFAIKTFDYDGQKYKAKESSLLLPKIEKEIEELKVKITNNDVAIFSYFYQLAKDKEVGSELKSKYNQFFTNDEVHDKKAELYIKLLNATDFLRVTTPFETIVTNLETLKKHRNRIKKKK